MSAGCRRVEGDTETPCGVGHEHENCNRAGRHFLFYVIPVQVQSPRRVAVDFQSDRVMLAHSDRFGRHLLVSHRNANLRLPGSAEPHAAAKTAIHAANPAQKTSVFRRKDKLNLDFISRTCAQ